MANYTISKFTATEKIGDSVFTNSMVTSGTLTITPIANYVVSASDFSISSLPSNISSVTFTDTTVAGEPRNLVTVTANIDSSFILSADTSIYLDIDGDAKIYNPETKTFSIDINIEDHQKENALTKTKKYGSSSYNAETDFTINTTIVDNVEISNISGTLTKNKRTKVGELTITADSGFYFISKPYLRILNSQKNIVKIVSKSVTRDSNNFKTSYVFDIICNINTNVSNVEGYLFYRAVAIPTTTPKVIGVEFGRNIVSALGQKKTITVLGDTDAEFDLTVTKQSNGLSILSSSNKNTTISTPEQASIDAINHKIKKGIGLIGNNNLRFTQIFPAGTDTYDINIYPKNGTILSSGIPITKPHYVINQYANPTLTLSTTTANPKIVITAATAIVYTGKPNTSASKLLDTKNRKKRFSISWAFTRDGGDFSSIARQPRFSSTDSSLSDFTNSLYNSSATTPAYHGTHIEIFNLVATIVDTANATITADVLIKQWGTGNVTMSIPVSSIFTMT
jgi:hypothetical protein